MKRVVHTEEKWVFPFIEYSPEKITGKLPLVIQLHGAGERGTDINLVDFHGFSKHFAKGYNYDCITVMPQCPSDTFWVARIESIVRFIEQICESYDIDEDRISLTGISMGGYGTWFTAMARPDIFSCIAPVCGGGMPWCAPVLKMPVRAFHGTADKTVLPHNTEDMVAKLEALGRPIDYVKLEGVGHNAQDYTYDDELMRWLIGNKR